MRIFRSTVLVDQAAVCSSRTTCAYARARALMMTLLAASCLACEGLAVPLAPWSDENASPVMFNYDPFSGSLSVRTTLELDSFGITSASGLFIPELADPDTFDSPLDEITSSHLFLESVSSSERTRFGNVLPRRLTFQQVLDDLDVTGSVAGVDIADVPNAGPSLCCDQPIRVFQPTTRMVNDAVVIVYDSTDGSLFLRSDIPVTTMLLRSFSELFIPEGAEDDAFQHVFDEKRPDELFEFTELGVTSRNYGQVLPVGLSSNELVSDLFVDGSLLPHGRISSAPGGGPYLLVVPEPVGGTMLPLLIMFCWQRCRCPSER